MSPPLTATAVAPRTTQPPSPGTLPGPAPTDPGATPGPLPPPTQEPQPPADDQSGAGPAEGGSPSGLLAVPVPSPADRHLLSRFSWGVNPGLMAEAADLGGALNWFRQQLRPENISDAEADQIASWWPHLSWTPENKWRASRTGMRTFYQQDLDFARWSLVYRIATRRQLLDVMADFWSNLLYVPIPRRESMPHRVRYDTMIRANALGTFDQLLRAAVLHPAMLCSLDNARSTRKAPNENLGRELLELHTIGHDAGFDEDDVLSSVRILTGYRVEIGGSCEPYYSERDHYVGPVNVMTYGARNSSPDGRQVTLDYLDYLARHEATANRIARRLAVRFVSDDPPQALVDHLAEVFTTSGTDIKTTLQALVEHPAFGDSIGDKVRTPCEDFANTYRALQVKIEPPDGTPGEASHAVLHLCATMGQTPFQWPRPDGFPDVGEAWSSASRMLGSWRVHKVTAGRQLPIAGVEFKDKDYWAPQLPIRFGELVDRLCRLLLARQATDTLYETARRAVGTDLDEMVTAESPVMRFRFPFLLLALLDTPDHMAR